MFLERALRIRGTSTSSSRSIRYAVSFRTLRQGENDVPVECVPPFRELRGIGSDSSLSQVERRLDEPE
jgi:hypothetical protein